MLQEVFYFPLTPRLKALLRTDEFRHLLSHEFTRPKNSKLISDIYDTKAWQEFVKETDPHGVERLRIILQFCVDGIPAFSADTKTLKPAEFINLSLPPSLRGLAKHILLIMLFPGDLKGPGQKKYYDFSSSYELDDLLCKGFFLCVVVNHQTLHTKVNIFDVRDRYRRSESESFWGVHGHQRAGGAFRCVYVCVHMQT